MKPLRLIALLTLAISYNIGIAQTQQEEATDTIVHQQVDVIEIPSKSAASIAELNRINKSILSEAKFNQLIQSNLLKLDIIDSMLINEKQVNLKIFNLRHLINKKTYWEQRLKQTQSIENNMSQSLEEIEAKTLKVKDIENEWIEIAKGLGDEEVDSVVNVNIQRVSIVKDSILNKLIHHRSELLVLQDKAIFDVSELTTMLEMIQIRIDDEENNVFARSKIVYGKLIDGYQYRSAYHELKKSIIIESRFLADYLSTNSTSGFLLLIIMAIGMMAFRQVKKAAYSHTDTVTDSYFEKQFIRILSAYKSTAFVLIIWLSAVIFPNQPLLFKDAMRVIICVPLAIILHRLLDRKLFFAILILFVLVIAQSFVNLFPPNHMIYKVFLFMAVILEFMVVFRLRNFINSYPFKRKVFGTILSKTLTISLMTLALVLILGFLGFVVLMELIVSSILTNTYTLALLFVSLLIANGLLEIAFKKLSKSNLKVFQFYGQSIKNKLIKGLTFTAQLLAIYSILETFNMGDNVVSFIKEVIIYNFEIGENMSFSLGDIIMLIIVLSLSIFVSNVIKTLLEEDLLARTKMGQGLPHTIALLAKYSLITIGVSFAIYTAGIPMQNFAVLIGAFGVGIGFGLQNIFNNLVSGLILLFERPIKINDTIEVGELLGKVKSIGIRSSIVRTFDGAEVIVPNGQLISNEVINWTHSDQLRRLEIIVGVAYGSDAERVSNILQEVLKSHEDILKIPAPTVLFINMGESSLDFKLLFWISNLPNILEIRSEVTQMVYDALNKEGISIPFPQRDIHIIKDKD
ncbi:mechanosensitive ion channel family protein [Carboxylicivirga marina]|uniref:Mechanosensitive ion channel n=1 Tax=Carboxylicivirga marina TaxID=2800988 RepID=A0ABS1HMG2_9BACT|nr:mechanosensitive ion channel domain-containing protein [Carboxylicivirga marina]MBK3518867.1 mechanosensitive ion channel [Carboxylicivirga marina]